MTNSEENIKMLLEQLLRSSQFATLDSLSAGIGLSKRSVQNYLDKVERWIVENALEQTYIEKKRGCGIRIRTTAADRKQIERLLDFKHLNIYSGDAKRRFSILKTLIFSKDEITIQLLSSQFYVSRATILSDLDWTSQWLAQYKLRLYKTQHRGIGIIGDEVAHRNAIAAFFDVYELGMLSSFDPPKPLGRFNEKSLRNLVEVYPRDTVLKVAKIIEDAEREFDFILLDDFFTSLLTHMVISVLRIANGNLVPKEFLPPEETFPPLETKTAEYIAMRMKKILGIELPPSEQAYICIHLVGYNAFSTEQDYGMPFPQRVEHLAITLVEAVDEALLTNYAHDKFLFFGLCLHLKTALYRLKVTTYTPKAHDTTLPPNWVEIYDVLKNVAPSLYEQIGQVSPDDDELIGLSYFFLLSHRRCTSPIRVLLISNLGIIPRMTLINELEAALPSIKIIDSCTAQQLHDWSSHRFSLIISTEPLEHCPHPRIDLSSVPSANYIGTVESRLSKLIPDFFL